MDRELHTSHVDHCLSLSAIDEDADVVVDNMVLVISLVKMDN